MSNFVTNFIRSTLGRINKSDVEIDLQNSITTINDLIEGYTKASSLIQNSNFQCPKSKELVKLFYRGIDNSNLDARLSMSKNFIDDSLVLFANAIKNGKELQNAIRDIKSNVIATNAISARNANILMAVPHFYFMVTYANALINYIIAVETEVINRAPTHIPKATVEMLEKDMRIYTTLVAVYCKKPETFANQVSMLSDVILTADENARVEEVQAKGALQLVNGLPNGFLGSPIYSIRSVIAKWQSDRYINMQDQKRLLELRLIHLETLKTGDKEGDAEIEGEIKEIQETVNKTNYKLAKMEASIE